MVKKMSVFRFIFLGLVTTLGFWKVTEVTGALVKSKAEKEALQKFRSLVEPELYRDFMKQDEYLVRWLKGQNFDVEKTQKKLLKALKWRKENEVDSIGNETIPEFARLCTFSLDSRDREGIPVFTSAVGGCPVRRLILSGALEKHRRFNFQSMEIFQSIMQKVDTERNEITKAVGIMDLSGFNWREHGCLPCLQFQQEQFSLADTYYPKFFKHFFLINAPRVFQNFLALLRPFFSQQSIQTWNIYGLNKEEWSKEILKLIDPKQLTSQFGGSRKTFEPFV